MPTASEYLERLLQEEGLPDFDAVGENEVINAYWRQLWRIRYHLTTLMEEAVTQEDDTRFAELLRLLLRLNDCTWIDITPPFPVVGSLSLDGLTTEMASLLGRKWPNNDESSYAKRLKDGRRLAHEFIRERIDGETAFAFLELHRSSREQIRNWHEQKLRNAPWFQPSWYGARACGMLALILLAVWSSLFATELLLCAFGNREFVQSRPPRTFAFWMAALCILPASGALIYRACDLTMHVPGFGPRPDPEILSDQQQDAIILTAPVLLLAVPRLLSRDDCKCLFKNVRAAALLMYVVLVCTNAHLRHDMVERIRSRQANGLVACVSNVRSSTSAAFSTAPVLINGEMV